MVGGGLALPQRIQLTCFKPKPIGSCWLDLSKSTGSKMISKCFMSHSFFRIASNKKLIEKWRYRFHDYFLSLFLSHAHTHVHTHTHTHVYVVGKFLQLVKMYYMFRLDRFGQMETKINVKLYTARLNIVQYINRISDRSTTTHQQSFYIYTQL